LAEYFDAVVVSGDLGIAKPDPSIFEHALEQLGVDAADAVMVGDSMSKDVEGALAAGMRAVWVNRSASSDAIAGEDFIEIATLSVLPDLLDTIRR
jgi:putative hydrolase of the HAD superfamily